jgi:hypothetical protein
MQAGRDAARQGREYVTMGTGDYVNFSNDDDEFNIALDTAGHLNFMANEHSGAGSRRMSILDDTNEVSFDGSITVDGTATIGGSGQDGALQLRASDGSNTVFLGSSASETTVHVGGDGRPGEMHLYNTDHNATFNLYGEQALMTLGTDGQAGDIFVYDGGGELGCSTSGGVLGLHVDGHRTITLDGSQAKVSVGSTGNGVVELKDSAGTVRIRLSAATSSIEFFDATGNSTAALP